MGIDARYWERQRERSRKPKSDQKPSDNRSTTTSSSDNTPRNNNQQHFQSSTPPKKSGTPSNSATPPKKTENPKLGKDGKLTPNERQRRFDNNLCMFCGGVGHKAPKCPKKSSNASKAKARAAEVQPKN
jgi:hypothetical protein